ncbi:MAG: hypothetical protein AAFX10_10035 [Pseudomonadota bacterium]
MPEIVPLGWFHTVMGIVALVSGFYTLAKFKEITPRTPSGLVYLLSTLVTAGTALGIFQHGVFTPAHTLAILTLLALTIGTVASTTLVFGRLSRYLRAISYSATLLFHAIPAITDGLMRLPVGNPVLDSIDSPVLRVFYLLFLLIYLVGVAMQIRWIRRQPAL